MSTQKYTSTAEIRLTGREPGFRKVAFTKLLVKECGMDLKDAQQKVTALLDGHVDNVSVPTDRIGPFLDAASVCGARAELKRAASP